MKWVWMVLFAACAAETTTPTPELVALSSNLDGYTLVHTGDLDDASVPDGNGWIPVVDVLIHDASHQPVVGVYGFGRFEQDDVTNLFSCSSPTDAAGRCSIVLPRTHKRALRFRFLGVAGDNLPTGPAVFVRNDSHDPDGDDTLIVTLRRP